MKNQIEEFEKYINDYLKYGDMCILKKNHTYRVMNYCEEISKSLNLDSDHVRVSKLCGLLHDISRFEQWKNYKTFVDRLSFDHGDRGYELLKNNNYILKYNKNKKENNYILNSVKYHNKYKVPSYLDNTSKLFVNITRDADKLDILNLYLIGELEVKKYDDTINKVIINNIKNNKTISRKDKINKVDAIGILVGFIFDFNYKYSYEYLYKEKIYDKLLDLYIEKNDNNDLVKQIKELKEIVRNILKRRCI